MPLDYQTIKNWPFAAESRRYDRADLIRYARGFGAGMPGVLQRGDARYLSADGDALPMVAVALADGEFWQKDPRAGLRWQQIVHAEEAITVHRPLPPQATIGVQREVREIYDRGVDKGAMVLEQQRLVDAAGAPLVTIDVITVLRGDGGFGGSAEGAPKPQPVPADRPPDSILELSSPRADNKVFALSTEFDVTGLPGMRPEQVMLRGMCAFGLAGRAVLGLVCDNEPARLRRLSVRYVGALLSDETVRVELWRTAPGRAAFRMHAIERDVPLLNHCHAEFDV